MDSQPQNPELWINPENFHPCEYQSVVRNMRKEEAVYVIKESHFHTYYLVRSSHNVLFVMHHLPYVTSFWNVIIFHR